MQQEHIRRPRAETGEFSRQLATQAIRAVGLKLAAQAAQRRPHMAREGPWQTRRQAKNQSANQTASAGSPISAAEHGA